MISQPVLMFVGGGRRCAASSTTTSVIVRTRSPHGEHGRLVRVTFGERPIAVKLRLADDEPVILRDAERGAQRHRVALEHARLVREQLLLLSWIRARTARRESLPIVGRFIFIPKSSKVVHPLRLERDELVRLRSKLRLGSDDALRLLHLEDSIFSLALLPLDFLERSRSSQRQQPRGQLSAQPPWPRPLRLSCPAAWEGGRLREMDVSDR